MAMAPYLSCFYVMEMISSSFLEFISRDSYTVSNVQAERVPEAAFLARTYLPSEMSRVLALWKENLGKVRADTGSNPSLPIHHLCLNLLLVLQYR